MQTHVKGYMTLFNISTDLSVLYIKAITYYYLGAF